MSVKPERDDDERDEDGRLAPVKQVKKLRNMHVPFRE